MLFARFNSGGDSDLNETGTVVKWPSDCNYATGHIALTIRTCTAPPEGVSLQKCPELGAKCMIAVTMATSP
jgi:hypothetical protein